MTIDERDKRDREDLEHLLAQRQFLRFLSRVIQRARIFERTTDGSQGRDLSFTEGVRHLGLEILEMVEAGQPVPHPDGTPILTVLQVLREEANQPGGERPNGRRQHERYDRNNDLGNDDGDDG